MVTATGGWPPHPLAPCVLAVVVLTVPLILVCGRAPARPDRLSLLPLDTSSTSCGW